MTPTVSLHLSEGSIRLSSPLTATITIEGAAPLIVTPPAPLLAESARSSWVIAPAGPSTIEKLIDGQERWTQTYQLEPYAVGNSVPVAFAPFTVRTGFEAATIVNVPPQHVAVTTEATATDLRGLTGPELPPTRPSSDSAIIAPVLIVIAAAIILLAIWRQRRTPAPKLPVSPVTVLSQLSLDDPCFAERLSDAIRDYLGPPARLRTTDEIAARHPEAAEILRRCDQVKFAGESLSQVERQQLRDHAIVLAAGQTHPRP